ncbi:alpha/beta hydrolase [Nocardia vinacea]|uniref:Alpha/beta hydrolase n=1 Tax=Nocardia vinacea TaxID=96468 RepID=A0ABZ1YGP8_9NOCA|nr:alpha/beta hydrolase [Nocardia vinacea]
MFNWRRRSARHIGLTALFLVAACGAQAQPEQSPHLDNTPGVGKYYHQTLVWGSCDGFENGAHLTALECARVTVPIDYAEPDGKTARLAISRLRARGQKVASILTNPGGPGGIGLTLPADLAQTPLAERFDVVGIDLRGLGASTPKLICDTPEELAAERAGLAGVYVPFWMSQAEHGSMDLAAKCVQRTGLALLSHVGTAESAADLDIVRAALGEEKLTYFGASYGTRLGSAYAEMFPDRVRAMVLDGAADPATNIADPVIVYAGLQRAFDAYAADCGKAPDCPIGTDPAKASERMAALLRPLADRPATTNDGRGLGYSNATTGVISTMYTSRAWPVLTRGLTELTKGHGDILLTLADSYLAPESVDIGYKTAVSCLDDTRIADRKSALELDRRVRAAAPAFDSGRAADWVPFGACTFWPVPPTSRPHTPTVTGLPKLVVVSSTGDPVTPYQGATNLARALGATLVTYEGIQHGSFLDGVKCVDEPVLKYLIELTPPQEGLRCPTR